MAATSHELRTQIFKRRLHAKINAEYYRKVAFWLRGVLLFVDAGLFVTSSGSIAKWFADNRSDWVPTLALISLLFVGIERIWRLKEKIVTLDFTIKQWERQANDWNALWLRHELEADSVGLADFQRAISCDPPDLEGQIFRYGWLLEKAKAEVLASDDLDEPQSTEEKGKPA
jgi:hypothetical protein